MHLVALEKCNMRVLVLGSRLHRHKRPQAVPAFSQTQPFDSQGAAVWRGRSVPYT